MLNALRLKQGFDIATFIRHTGLSAGLIAQTCEQAVQDGMLAKKDGGFAATDHGYLFLNDLINRFSYVYDCENSR